MGSINWEQFQIRVFSIKAGEVTSIIGEAIKFGKSLLATKP